MSGSDPSAPALNIGLLNRLRAAAGQYVPIVDLAAGCSDGASRSSDPVRVHADLDALESFGFAIERHPLRGAAYLGPAERLCPDQIEHELGTHRIGRRIAVWDRVASTNDLAAGARGSSCNDGLVILADEQTAGRGRLGRPWTAPPRSSILMSVLVFPPGELDASGPDGGRGIAWLTAIGAVATAEVVSAWIGRAARIKWPNDVRVDGRKVAGILVERPSAHGPAAVIGIGLNVNLVDDDYPIDLRGRATSIRIERGGRPADRSEVARDLIRRLDHWDEAVRARGPGALNAPWRARSEHLGQFVRVLTPAGSRSGRLVDLDLELGLTLDPWPEDGAGQESPDGVGGGPAIRLVRIPLAETRAIETDPDSGVACGRPWTVGPAGS